MTGRRSHGRLSALNGVVHQGSSSEMLATAASMYEDDVSKFPTLSGR